MKKSWRLAATVSVVGLLALTACGSSSKKSTPAATTPPTVATTAPAETTTTTKPPSKQQGTATPSTGLTEGTEVTVKVTGFTAGKTVGINECSTATDDTGSGCDLGGLVTMKIAADGTATGKIKVKVGPFGKDKVVCTKVKAPDKCILSVGELAAGDVERADDIPITFAS